MRQRGYRKSLYTRRHWRCEECRRHGFVLIHRDDTPRQGFWRRAHSHRAKVGHHRDCSGRHLLWFTTSEEFEAADEQPRA